MSSSIVTANPIDAVSSNNCSNESPSVIVNMGTKTENNTIDITITTSDSNSSLGQQTQHVTQKPQVLPLVYIQAPTKLNAPFLPASKTCSTNNVIVNNVSPLQLTGVSDKCPTIALPTNIAPNQGVIFGNSLKTPQLVIQKPGNMQALPVVPVPVSSNYSSKITGAYLTMLKPLAKNSDSSNVLSNRVQMATLNKIKPNESIHILNSATLASTGITVQNQKYVIAPMPKVGTNRLPVTATTNSVQSKIAIMPVTLPKPHNSSTTKAKIFNFKISDGQLQNENNSVITVMCDSTHGEPKQTIPKEDVSNNSVCDEGIHLGNSEKKDAIDERSYELSIIEDTSKNGVALLDQMKKDVPKMQKHGISILKKNTSFSDYRKTDKPNSLIISPVPNSAAPISESNKEVNIDVEEEPVIVPEPKAVPQRTERRRKSNFSYRKDYDDVPVTSSGEWKNTFARFKGTDITLTELDDDEKKEMKGTVEDLIEIEVIKENAEINMKGDADVMKILEWDDGIGTLPGSDLRFQMNEYGFLEFVTKDEFRDVLIKKMEKAKEKENKPTKEELQEEICCINCGCYGMLSDFISHQYCSYDCQESKMKLTKDKEPKIKKKKKKLFRKGDSPTHEQTPSDEDATSNENSQDKFNYPWACTKKGFSWSKYLDHVKAKSAPVKLFKDPFPYNRNGFRPGMKLEGVDPQHPSYFCVLTVAEILGYRVRLHFDGFPENYDFWVNADSMDIFPIGWCEKYGHVLQPPRGYSAEEFNWNNYLKQTGSTAAPKHLFTNRAGNAICPNGFRVGMKLEAVDRKNTTLVCVATITDMMDNRILVHFDSWDTIYDYWADPTSPYIHPVGWCDQYGHNLTPPNDYPDPESFTWDKYLKETKSVAAPVRAFKQRPACGFRRGMRLECVDRRVPQIIRVATVDDVNGHQIRISFDGWPDRYSYWVDDDSPDIHPVGWCQKTGHPLEPPLTPDDVYDFLECVTVGCRGQGHIKGPKFSTHHNQKYCPYAEENIDQEKILPDRLLSPDQQPEAVVPVSREPREKIKPKLGRPPKQRVEPPKLEWNEDSSQEQPKPKRKYRKRLKSESPDYVKKAVVLTNGFASSPAERQVWEKHSRYLSEFVKCEVDPREWSEQEVVDFVTSIPSCKDHGALFSENNITGETLLMLTQQDLVDILKIKLGPAIKLYNSILLLRQNVNQFFA